MPVEKSIRRSAFESARLTLYTVFFFNGLVQYISPFPNLCDYEGYSCAFCGMRRAVDLLLMGEIKGAYQSNPLILLLIAILAIMGIDTINIISKRLHKWFRIENAYSKIGENGFLSTIKQRKDLEI